ncbi:MAG TPA: 2OG-Fe dioxygenase family protein [Nevskiaceae bacterium]|nr:2OG-Fe dioxygenase family protein [Nevskiaceae bacterium]
MISRSLSRDGFARLRPDDARALFESFGSLDDWDAFAASWDRLPHDGYMADGGRYRRRRHATFSVTRAGAAERRPHQPHYQSRDYNPLNGGVVRWFEPVEANVGAGPTMTAILACCAKTFEALAPPEVADWHVEVHQFRVEATADAAGNPTPEGRHQDGVDFVLVVMVRRHNVASGTTTLHTVDGRDLGSFTLTAPFDAVLIDDARVVHGVTPVRPLDAAQPAFRDVLVVTFRRV